ncbi:CooT family nickel-binding protein [Chloroflexota bacterium]
MCLAKAYLKDGGEGELVIEDVALLEVEGRMVRLSTIFGEQKELEAVVKQVDLNNSRIILAKAG